MAEAAMADLGNKVFVLLVLYLVAMNWHYKRMSQKQSATAGLGKLLKVMLCEPVNLFIFAALTMLTLGFSMNTLPFVFSETLEKLSLLMTPLVLLYIGLVVKLKKGHLAKIISLLLVRAGLALILVAFTIVLLGISIGDEMVLLMAFSLSACSFWPFAHLASVDALENKLDPQKRTFNPQFAVAILAFSFPLSTVLNLSVLNAKSYFFNPTNIILIGMVLLVLGLLLPLSKKVAKVYKERFARTNQPQGQKLQRAFKAIFPFL